MIDKAIELIKKSNDIVVLTGAGISTESGLPDFRSNGGLWDGLKPEEISSPEALKNNTEAFVEFFTKRITDIQGHSPNVAHEILAKWQKEKKLTIITQNIDGYHQAAGATDVIEMHGHARHLQCDSCGTWYDHSKYTHFKDSQCEMTLAIDDRSWPCEGIVRVPVVLFGELLPALEWHKAQMAIQTADLVVVLGTSLTVFPFNELVYDAWQGGAGAKVIIVTQSETPFDYAASVRIHDPIGETLKKIDEGLAD